MRRFPNILPLRLFTRPLVSKLNLPEKYLFNSIICGRNLLKLLALGLSHVLKLTALVFSATLCHDISCLQEERTRHQAVKVTNKHQSTHMPHTQFYITRGRGADPTGGLEGAIPQ